MSELIGILISTPCDLWAQILEFAFGGTRPDAECEDWCEWPGHGR